MSTGFTVWIWEADKHLKNYLQMWTAKMFHVLKNPVYLTGLFSTAATCRPLSPLHKHKGMQQLFHVICPMKSGRHIVIRTLIVLCHPLWSWQKLHETTDSQYFWLLSGKWLQLSMRRKLHSFTLRVNHPFGKDPVWPSHICSCTLIANHMP